MLLYEVKLCKTSVCWSIKASCPIQLTGLTYQTWLKIEARGGPGVIFLYVHVITKGTLTIYYFCSFVFILLFIFDYTPHIFSIHSQSHFLISMVHTYFGTLPSCTIVYVY